MNKIRIAFFYTLLLMVAGCLTPASVWAQGAFENHRNEVYNFLSRMAQKGMVEFDDNVRPLSRVYLQNCLDSVAARSSALTAVEKKELGFYLREYTDRNINEGSSPVDFFRKDTAGRWRFLNINTNKFMLRFDPVLTAAMIEGNGRSVQQYSSGFSMYGNAGKHWGFYFSYNDVNEKGTGIDTLRSFTPVSGIVTKIASNRKSHNYSELRGGVTYSFKNGMVSFGQDNLLWGYGEGGRIVLSDKAPTYPYVRFDYRPLKWLSFHYTHAWLNSDIVDSTRTYPTGTGGTFGSVRQIFVPKFMAMHSLQVTVLKGLDITVGESMVYSDRIDAGYLVPVLFWKAYDNIVNNNNINTGSNGALFLQVSSRNHIPKTHLYGSLFIDEISVSNIFDSKKSRNQVAATIGGNITDLLVPYLTMGVEYTRVNPFVYRNLLPAQNYSNHNYSLGDWMGNNADRFVYTLRYTPLARLKCQLQYQYIRKGGAGTTDQQYFQQPQPSFLFDLQRKQSSLQLQLNYEWVHRLNLYAIFDTQHTDYYTPTASTNYRQVMLGVRYGL